ncbi:MAG: thioredoxin domain-containing protein [Hyphomicrobium sp.]|nr:thioredoxin domain-containing protein [Hyphomicrobium sp.]
MTRLKHLRFGVLAVALGLSACGADGLPPSASLSKGDAAAGAAYPSISANKKEDLPVPFGDPSAATVGGREVIEKPTIADIFAQSPMPEMAWGRADAPVTIVQYASLTCPHCRNFHAQTFAELKRTYIDTGKVRYILREFPIGKTSGLATIALRCAAPDKYLELYGKFMEQQNNWVSQDVRPDAIYAVAQQVGMKRAEFDACRENQGMIENLKWVKDRGRKLGIVGTPNYFVGDQLIKKELTMADIRAHVEARVAGGTPTAAAPKPQ